MLRERPGNYLLSWLALISATVVAIVVLGPSLGASPAVGAAGPTKARAVALVSAVLKKNASECRYRVTRLTARTAGKSWRVTAIVTGNEKGASVWTVAGRSVKPINELARRIRSGCPQAPAPPSPPPPPTPAPLPGPGAPATYAFGPELNAAQQALARRGLDSGARYFRAALGRELPTFTVWAHADLEAMIRTYAETRPTSLDDARRLWEGGQVGHATPRKVWLGPAWFQTSSSSQERSLKIAAHEAFHLLQYETVGERPLGVSGLDEIPSAGPWWLAEGAAEYFAYLAVAADGASRFADVRAGWVRSAKATSATLVALATLRGQRETPNAYDIYALATELLLQGRDPKLVFIYYEAIARGVPWPEAFAGTFGRTHDAFVGEFETFRRASAS